MVEPSPLYVPFSAAFFSLFSLALTVGIFSRIYCALESGFYSSGFAVSALTPSPSHSSFASVFFLNERAEKISLLGLPCPW